MKWSNPHSWIFIEVAGPNGKPVKWALEFGAANALFRFAAMTGLRRGEQIALRWADIDWTARRVRVRENIVRGRTGKPKSKRSTRSVPLAQSGLVISTRPPNLRTAAGHSSCSATVTAPLASTAVRCIVIVCP